MDRMALIFVDNHIPNNLVVGVNIVNSDYTMWDNLDNLDLLNNLDYLDRLGVAVVVVVDKLL